MDNSITQCQICGSKGSQPIFSETHPGLMRCTDCGFAYFKKVPSTEELIRHYQSYNRNDAISSITIKRYNELLEKFEAHRKTNRILDVGCGNGHLLRVAKEKKWEVHGTEFTDEAISICKRSGIMMEKGILNTDNYLEGSFDAICFIEVIEHIQNGDKEIQKFHKLLRSGGLVYITTPNFAALSGKLAGKNWNIIEYPEHLSYYRPMHLDMLLKKNGFKRISLSTSGFSYNRILNSQNRNYTSKNQNIDESFREKSENKLFFKLLKETVNAILSITSTGDTIKAFYQKK